jgi:hypothetical protein
VAVVDDRSLQRAQICQYNLDESGSMRIGTREVSAAITVDAGEVDAEEADVE